MVTIDFSAVRPNEIGLECYRQWKGSTFQATYQSAERCLRDMVRAKGGAQETELFQLQSPDSQNRVMAFVGDRGTGKTSAMISFVNACVDGSVIMYEPGSVYGGEERRCSFYTLPVIEPSGFSDGESIVGCVVSQIYSELEEYHHKLDRSLIQTIVNQCTDVREAIRVRGMSSQALLEQNSDELSHLRLLAQTKRLRERLGKLIDSYLAMCAVCNSKSSNGVRAKENSNLNYLIVPIDDIDTSIHTAYRLAEELRRYFMLANVIVVMALKVEQLSDALEQCFINEFKDLYTAGLFFDTQPVAMAAKYIQKLIPEQRQIHMPSLSLTEQSSCILRTEEGNRPLVGYMLELVYRKTGLLLIPDEWESHPLIPHNLRALHQMLSLFQEMTDTAKLRGLEGRQQYFNQLERAEKWLLGHIASNQIPANLNSILREFATHQDQGVNAFLWRALGWALREDAVPEARALMDRSVRNDNISVGDVLHLLQVLEETDVESSLALFGAAVRMLYSIRLRRGMIQSLDLDTEDLTVDEALSDMPDVGYQRVWRVLNGLIYDPVQRLTYDGVERMYNGDALCGRVLVSISECEDGQTKITQELHSLHSGATLGHDDSNTKAMSPEGAVWSSMFIVGFGRVRHRDIHSLESPILTGILLPSRQRGADADVDQNGELAFLSSNWMAFAHNLLLPQYTADRLLWQISSRSKGAAEAFRAEVDKLKKIRFAILFQCLHLDSADFLHRLICHMMAHTEEICQTMSDGLATFNGFFDFKQGLKEGIKTVMARSCLKEPGAGQDKLDAFLSVPGEKPKQDGQDRQDGYQRYDWMRGK